MYDRQMFLVRLNEESNIKFFTWALDRENAKRNARQWMGGDPDKYIVDPLTKQGDRVKLDLILSI